MTISVLFLGCNNQHLILY